MFGKTEKEEEDGECIFEKKTVQGFPVGPVVKNPPSYAGDTGSVPGQETKIPHAAGQPSPCPTTPESAHSRAGVPQFKKSPHTARKTPFTPTKIPRAATKTQMNKRCCCLVGKSRTTL